jgi:twitching motility protein PilJ
VVQGQGWDSSGMGLSEKGSSSSSGDDEMFSITSASEQIPVFNQTKEIENEPIVSVEQGILAFFENASLQKKQWILLGRLGGSQFWRWH